MANKRGRGEIGFDQYAVLHENDLDGIHDGILRSVWQYLWRALPHCKFAPRHSKFRLHPCTARNNAHETDYPKQLKEFLATSHRFCKVVLIAEKSSRSNLSH